MPALTGAADNNEDDTVELRGRTIRSASRHPGVTGMIRVSSPDAGGTAELRVAGLDRGDITCGGGEGELVELGLTNYPAGDGQVVLVAALPDLLALLVRAIGVVKRKNLEMGLPRLPNIGLDDIEPADLDDASRH